MPEIELRLPGQPARVALVASEFNRFVTEQLVAGARAGLAEHGLDTGEMLLAWVPGAFELPLAADRVLAAGKADAIIALGAVIRGETAHFDYVAGECSRGLAQVSLNHGRPVVFGVLTTDSVEQALARAAVDQGNKGYDCALAALHMLGLIERLDE
ncbi:MAG TPA: 6,7-dimethyl-8-ribityllumazine synthase [Xanthomonadales bacterium]|nr:6,7-dimethyl-8-ribityllumazine synthase [Xanthomonadales bacterium]